MLISKEIKSLFFHYQHLVLIYQLLVLYLSVVYHEDRELSTKHEIRRYLIS